MKRAVESRLFLSPVTKSPGHISNIAKRGIHGVLSDVAKGFITGFGMPSYILGLEAGKRPPGVPLISRHWLHGQPPRSPWRYRSRPVRR